MLLEYVCGSDGEGIAMPANSSDTNVERAKWCGLLISMANYADYTQLVCEPGPGGKHEAGQDCSANNMIWPAVSEQSI